MHILKGLGRMLRTTLFTVGRYGLYIGCATFSLFILASGYESIYNRSLPVVQSLASVQLAPLTKTYDIAAAYQENASFYGQFGKPATLTIPGESSAKRLSIVAPVKQSGKQGDTWLARSATAHLLIPTKPVSGNISTAILYCRASFRTISSDALPKTGSNLFIDTDEQWRYVYKVTLSKTYATAYPYTPGERSGTSKGKLIIFCNDSKHQANDVVEADLISVQGVTAQ